MAAARIQTVTYSMPRGDSRVLPLAVPVSVYTTGASIFFCLKLVLDDLTTDVNAVVTKTLTDANIVSNDGTNVNYLMTLAPSDTNVIPPNTYFAEFEYVSADKSVVISYPDTSVQVWKFQITRDDNRRTS